MPELLDQTTRMVTQSLSPIGFATTGGDHWKVWDRFLTIDGEQAYHLGNICGTCAFFFERMPGADKTIQVSDLTALLSDGLTKLPEEVVDQLALLMPPSRYVVVLLRVKPEVVQLFGSNDYFAIEQVENEGDLNDPSWPPYDPKVPYYRLEGRSSVAMPRGVAFDFIVPMFSETLLNNATVNRYARLLDEGHAPTAVAISLLDVKGPATTGTDHWCMAHYVIDGHHKIAAAARSQKELTLLSFIAVDHGISSEEEIEIVLKSFMRSL